ncbi:hypothetical protein M378DRAFT_170607 [Amanita muscaria Koide BX008]|uniref:Uncharacterized protein n=1 Tax=Amanita muscaria (strain Koide BX008) TaxID=946122 RepID=A0A0C2S6S2_AMAMK|nr:hypothetical protein M378DRAFT_170607 [Amanita muscaria Koide BX008]
MVQENNKRVTGATMATNLIQCFKQENNMLHYLNNGRSKGVRNSKSLIHILGFQIAYDVGWIHLILGRLSIACIEATKILKGLPKAEGNDRHFELCAYWS